MDIYSFRYCLYYPNICGNIEILNLPEVNETKVLPFPQHLQPGHLTLLNLKESLKKKQKMKQNK